MNRTIKSLYFLLSILSPMACFAQQDSIYFDIHWKKTVKEHAAYYRFVTKLAENNYKVEDHYMNGNIQMTGYHSSLGNVDADLEPDTTRNGLFTYYHDSSLTKVTEGVYEKGMHSGTWKGYFKNSNILKAEYHYENGKLSGLYAYYDSTTRNKVVEEYYEKGLRTGAMKFYDSASGNLTGVVNCLNGDRNGDGIYYYSNGKTKAKGIYKDDRKEGDWEFYYDSGEIKSVEHYSKGLADGPYKSFDSVTHRLYLEGQYANDLPIALFKVYSVQTGELYITVPYERGKVNGEECFYDNGKKKHIVTFKDGIKNGRDVEYYKEQPEIKKSEGYNANGKKTGEWKTYYMNGSLGILEHFDEDKLSGVVISYDSATGYKTNEGTFVNDMRNGAVKYYTKGTKNVYLIETYKNDSMEGAVTGYYENGDIKYKGNYLNGARDGTWKYFFRNGHTQYLEGFTNKGHKCVSTEYDSLSGKILSVESFVDKKKQGECKYYFPGTDSLSAVEHYEEDSLQGVAAYYYRPGYLKSQGSYTLGVMTGAWKYYYRNGHLRSMETYTSGLSGDAVSYDSINGNVLFRGKNIKDTISGEWTYYYPGTEKIAVTRNYYNGVSGGEVVVYDTGAKIICRGGFNKNQKTGKWLYYYGGNHEKKIWISVNFKDDVRDGVADVFYTNGKKMVSREYKEGSLVSENYYDDKGMPLAEPDLKMRLAADKRLGEIQQYLSAFSE